MPAVALTSEKFAAAAEKLPSTPQVFARLNAAIKDPDVGLDAIANLVKLDPSLSARVLRLSNSPMFGRGDPVTNLTEAINRTGLDEIYRLVGIAMSSQLYVTGLPIYGVGGDELSVNALTTALAMENLADQNGEDRHVAYTLGLLRSVGRLVLQRLAASSCCAPLAGRKASADLVHAWEKETFGLNHADAAERLFALWKFPSTLCQPIRHQFHPDQDQAHSRLTAMLHLAGWVADSLSNGLIIEKAAWTVSPDLLSQAGLNAEAPNACCEHTRAQSAALTLMLSAA